MTRLQPTIVLGSSSARRIDLLRRVGVDFTVEASNVDERKIEAALADIEAEEVAVALTAAKTEMVAERRPDALVIGADTVVVVDNVRLGKPLDRQDASHMIEMLQGGTHQVVTAVEARRGGVTLRMSMTTSVRMRQVGQAEIDEYVASGEPMDKAGGYAVQGQAGRFIETVEGCYLTVVGFPLCVVATLLQSFGARIPSSPIALCEEVATELRRDQPAPEAGYSLSDHPSLGRPASAQRL